VGDFYRQIIEEELNIKKAEFVSDVSAFSSYSFKPQLKTVGPKYGKLLGKIREALTDPSLDGNAAMSELTEKGALTFNFDGETVELTEADLLIETQQMAGYYSVSDHGITVALDTNLTEELINEGFVREVISKIQTMRKEADFVVTDHITVDITGSEKLTAILTASPDEVKTAVLCDTLTFGAAASDSITKEWDINGENVALSVKRV